MSTTATRAASVRRQRAAAARPSAAGTSRRPDRDPCPLCSAELVRPQGTTRRLAVLTSAPGFFTWQCPDCAGTWTEGGARRTGAAPASGGTPHPTA